MPRTSLDNVSILSLTSFLLEIQSRMKDEKNKLKYMQTLVREKQSELSAALQYSKVQDMENRILELKKESMEQEKKMTMLESMRKKQIHCINDQNSKEQKSLE